MKLATARRGRAGTRTVAWRIALCAVAAIAAAPAAAIADQSSQPASPAAGHISAGTYHTCAVPTGSLRCWGFGGAGQLGYAGTASIGDDETPASLGPLNLGAPASAISAGSYHNCAILSTTATVRCWGFGGDGRLGYASTNSIGDDEPAASAGAVDLGAGRTATAVAAGGAHSCAVLDNGTVRCWGYANDGRLGFGNRISIGDDETPGSAGPVDLGSGSVATAITAGDGHTCALVDNGPVHGIVRCWGYNGVGQLGYGHVGSIGDDEMPASVAPVDLGAGHTAKAISAGANHTCAVLDDNTVRCWGYGGNGQLGYANTNTLGDDETPASTGPVDLGAGHTAKAISAGGDHSCAILDDNAVRCWGSAGFGQLGYASTNTIGDTETPGSAGPVALGPSRSAVAISAGDLHTCALLDDTSVRCWGYGAEGRLGYCNTATIGDNEGPAAAGPVDLGAGGAACPAAPAAPSPASPSAPPAEPAPVGDAPAPAAPPSPSPVDPFAVEAARKQALRSCRRAAAKRATKLARLRGGKLCLRRYARTPGRVMRVTARATSATALVLGFSAPGSDGRTAPAARRYLVKQSLRPIRTPTEFSRAHSLCQGSCAFPAMEVGTKISLAVTQLRRHSTYYYAVAARDNVSNRLGPRSFTAIGRTR